MPHVGFGCRHDVTPLIVTEPKGVDGCSGFGLAIVRHIARSHGDDITLCDSPLGGSPAAVHVPV